MSQYAVSRPVKKRTVVRAFNDETAFKALEQGGFGPGRECFCFNKGQFSIIDVIVAALRFTGPAKATVATWTAADADLRRAAETLKCGLFTSVQWIVDRSFETRQPTFCHTMRELFGDHAIRTLNSHCKFVLLETADWHIVIQTSMNLNFNKRIENFWIADDQELFEAYSELVDDVFKTQPAGESFGKNSKAVRAQTESIGRAEKPDPWAGVSSMAAISLRLPEI